MKYNFKENEVTEINQVKFVKLDSVIEYQEKILKEFDQFNGIIEKPETKQLSDEEELEVRKTIGTTSLFFYLCIPILLYLIISTLTQILNLNIEGLTGGLFRTFTGVLAYTSFEILVTILFLKAYFKITLIRLNTSTFEKNNLLDFLEDYFSLNSWQRIRVDLFVFSYVSFLLLCNTIALLRTLPSF